MRAHASSSTLVPRLSVSVSLLLRVLGIIIMDSHTHQESVHNLSVVLRTTIMDTNTHPESASTIMNTNNQESATCNLCRRNLKNTTLLNSHHIKHHYIRKCPNCYKTFRQTKRFLKHLRTHINDCPYECKICLKSFNSKRNLREHTAQHKNPVKKICEVCSAVCYHHFGLMRHMLTHGKRPYECSICDSVFSSVADRARHIKNHIITCALCKIPMKNEEVLFEHIKTFHRNKKGSELIEQPYLPPDIVVTAVCDSSDSMAESSSEDDSDGSLNEGEDNAAIESVYCAKHKGYFICFICLHLSPSSELLKYHMHAHAWFPCPDCPKFFLHKQELDMHKMKNHFHCYTTSDAIFECKNDLNLHEQKCSQDSNLESRLSKATTPLLSKSISQESDFEKKLDKNLKEIDKKIGEDCKPSCSFESDVDICTPSEALYQSKKDLLKKFPVPCSDVVPCLNLHLSTTLKKVNNLLHTSQFLKFPFQQNLLKEFIYLERFLEGVLINDTSEQLPNELKEDLQTAQLRLSNISDKHFSLVYYNM